MALLFRHNASESEHTLLYVHHFIFHPLHRLTESEQYHLLYSSIEDVPTIAEKLRYARHMKGLRQKNIYKKLLESGFKRSRVRGTISFVLFVK